MRHTKIKNKRKIGFCMLFVLVITLASHSVFGLGIGTFSKEIEYTPDETTTVKYYIIKESAEKPTVKLDIEGDIAPYSTFNTNNYWYSTKVDDLGVKLSRAFDLRNLTAATLTFQTKYNIESGWDFGYIEISTDDGTTWTQLEGTGTNYNRDPGAYVGINGAPAYSGVVSDWTLETVNLTPFVGNLTIFRFNYVTDSYYSEHGWLVDDIAIPEISFFDDVESPTTTWNTDGWVDDVLYLDDSSTSVPIEIKLSIPDSYVSNGSENKIVVLELPGADAGFNPTYASVPRIIARLPALTRYVAPTTPPSSGGGGGGGSHYSQHLTYRKGVVHYIVDRFFPGRAKTLKINKEDSIVREVEVIVNSVVDDAVIRITPLDEKPAMIKQDIRGVYRFFEVSTSRLFDSDIDEAILIVAVPKYWIEKEGETAEDVVVSRFHAGRWSDLLTELVDEDSSNYYYEVTTPGFSVFAVRMGYPIEDPAVIAPDETIRPKASDMAPVLVIDDQSEEEINDDLVETIKKKTGEDENLVREAIDSVVKIEGESDEELPMKSRADLWEELFGISAIVLVLLAIVLMLISRIIIRRDIRKKRKRSMKNRSKKDREDYGEE